MATDILFCVDNNVESQQTSVPNSHGESRESD